MQVKDLFEVMGNFFGVSEMEICCKIQIREVVYARKIFCWLLQKYLGYDIPAISAIVNNDERKIYKYLLDMKLIINNLDFLLSFQERELIKLILAECEKIKTADEFKDGEKSINN